MKPPIIPPDKSSANNQVKPPITLPPKMISNVNEQPESSEPILSGLSLNKDKPGTLNKIKVFKLFL
jgi:hypothetical protein